MVLVRRRNAVRRGPGARAEGSAAYPGRRRRPHDADRAARGQDLMALGRFLLLPRGRSDAGDRAEGAAGRPSARSSSSPGLASAPAISGARLREARGRIAAFAARPAAGSRRCWRRADFAAAVRLLRRARSARKAGGARRCSDAAGPRGRRPDRRVAGAARCAYEREHAPRCRASCAGSRRAAARSSATSTRTGAREVRIMTVHGAKGLQAPIVFLPDTTARAGAIRGACSGRRRRRRPGCGCRRAATQTSAARGWRAPGPRRAREEQNRLLYVAMTRAEDRLYVGGWVGARKPDRGCWYERIEAGLARQQRRRRNSQDQRAARPRRGPPLRLCGSARR